MTFDMGRLTFDIMEDRLVLCRYRTAEVFVGPRNKVLPVRPIRVAAVMLPPRKLAIEQTDIHSRHLFGLVIIGPSKIFNPEQPEHGLRRDCRHEATLMIEPLRVAFFGDAVADE